MKYKLEMAVTFLWNIEIEASSEAEAEEKANVLMDKNSGDIMQSFTESVSEDGFPDVLTWSCTSVEDDEQE